MRKSTIPGVIVLGLAFGGAAASGVRHEAFAFDRPSGGEIQLASDHRPVIINNERPSKTQVNRSESKRVGSDHARARSNAKVLAASEEAKVHVKHRDGSHHDSHQASIH